MLVWHRGAERQRAEAEERREQWPATFHERRQNWERRTLEHSGAVAPADDDLEQFWDIPPRAEAQSPPSARLSVVPGFDGCPSGEAEHEEMDHLERWCESDTDEEEYERNIWRGPGIPPGHQLTPPTGLPEPTTLMIGQHCQQDGANQISSYSKTNNTD